MTVYLNLSIHKPQRQVGWIQTYHTPLHTWTTPQFQKNIQESEAATHCK